MINEASLTNSLLVVFYKMSVLLHEENLRCANSDKRKKADLEKLKKYLNQKKVALMLRYQKICGRIDNEIFSHMKALLQENRIVDVCIDPAISNLPIEGFSTFNKVRLRRVLQKLNCL